MTDIENFIDAVVNKNYAKSNEMFSEILGQKVDQALDAEKIAMANVVFNNVEDPDDDDITDEELDEFLDDEDLEEDEEV